jgi:hypothetical protein
LDQLLLLFLFDQLDRFGRFDLFDQSLLFDRLCLFGRFDRLFP